MNISLLEPIGVTQDKIRELSERMEKAGHCFAYYETKTTDVKELIRRAAGQDIVMIANTPFPDEAVRALTDLKLLAVAFTGIDHVGLAACREKGVQICNCAGYSNQSVAELAVGMTIGLYRKLEECGRAVREGRTGAGLMGREIAGKTVGIVGCGRIGFRTAKLFRAFGARVLAFARHERENWKEEGIEAADLDRLLAESDIVSLHMPMNAQTVGFFDREKIAKMKPDAVFINCARGPVVDNQALALALREERLAGAAIDVFDMEPPIPEDYCLNKAPNVLLTPHVAFATQESMIRRAETEFDNVYAFLEGKPKNLCSF